MKNITRDPYAASDTPWGRKMGGLTNRSRNEGEVGEEKVKEERESKAEGLCDESAIT